MAPGRQTVLMFMLHLGTPADQAARAELAAALPGATVGEADDTGVFEIELDANDLDDALLRVWDAVAASATDEHLVFLEHPDLPGHWRERSGSPADPG
jgi:hypothetical protein